MNHPDHFRSNLLMLKEESGLSTTKFSELLELSRSTVQSVMGDGQTTLDTACRIANALQIPLCTMTGGALSPEKAKILHSTLTVVNWYQELPVDKQRNIREAFSVILDELEK